MEPALDPLFLILIVLIVAFVIFMVAKSGRRGRRQAQLSEDRSKAEVEAQALAMKKWQQAFVLANPGQPVPPPPAMTGSYVSGSERTNTLAILSLIFGILGGYLAIIFGHIALSQIKRTGERGGGMATAGLILGYLWLIVSVILAIFVIRAGSGR